MFGSFRRKRRVSQAAGVSPDGPLFSSSAQPVSSPAQGAGLHDMMNALQLSAPPGQRSPRQGGSRDRRRTRSTAGERSSRRDDAPPPLPPMPPMPLKLENLPRLRHYKTRNEDFQNSATRPMSPAPGAWRRVAVPQLEPVRPTENTHRIGQNIVTSQNPLTVGQDRYFYPLSYSVDAERLEYLMFQHLYPKEGPVSSVDWLSPPKTVLDVGAGYNSWIGRASLDWPETYFYALDVEELQSTSLRPIYPQQRRRIQFIKGDITEDIHLPRPTFDYIRVANMSLAITAGKWAGVLGRLTSMLAYGGVIEIIDDGWLNPKRLNSTTPVRRNELHRLEALFEDYVRWRGLGMRPDIWEHIRRVLDGNTELNALGDRYITVRIPKRLDYEAARRWHRTILLAIPAVCRREKIPDDDEDFWEDVRDFAQRSGEFLYRGSEFRAVVYQRGSPSPNLNLWEDATYEYTVKDHFPSLPDISSRN